MRPLEGLSPEDRRSVVLAALDGVTDPELDESVTAMGFISKVEIDRGHVAVEFRLPTFWCSANFAFLMAEDMRIAVERLAWVETAIIRLVDHFAAESINRGVAEGLPFDAIFAGQATEGLAAIRRSFRQKAFLGRQEALLRPLIREHGTEAALALTVAGLDRLCDGPDPERVAAARRYLAARRHDGGAADADAPAFTDLDGAPVTAEGCAAHLRAIRGVRSAAEANAEMCRILLTARYAAETSVRTFEEKREMSG